MDDEHNYSFAAEQLFEDQQSNIFQHFKSPVINPVQPNTERIVSSERNYKAMKTEEIFGDYPPDLKKNLINSSMKNKYLNGLQGIIGVSIKPTQSQHKFLQCIDSEVFNSQEKQKYSKLNQLFNHDDIVSPQLQVASQIQELTKRIEEIQRKVLSSISINKTIGKAFTEHFQNFLYLRQSSNFNSLFNESFENFLNEAKTISQPGLGLITLTYQFWMKMFKQFMREIWKHSQRYTLGIFKKQKAEGGVQQNSVKSTVSSSQTGGLDKQKRKPWNKTELDIIHKIIDANGVFSQARLKQLGQQFGRTPSSISSKVQKIIKNRKKDCMDEQQDRQDVSLETKIKYILEMHPKGLTKQNIIELINESYQMGIDQSWKNSVSSLLSSSPKFTKIKTPYQLKNPMFYYNYAFSSTFKDKIIQCLLKMPKNSGQVKQIAREYIRMFLSYQPQNQQLKNIQQNISKTLSRYDIFQRSGTKILYKLNNEYEFSISQQLNLNNILNFG